MKAKTFLTNTFLKGLDLDTDINLVDNSSYRDATNIRVIANTDGTTGIIQNTQGTVDLTAIYSGETVLGTTTVNDIAVVITLDESGYNNVWKITGLDTDEPERTRVIRAALGLTLRVSVVGNYESEDNVKVYFTDGTTTTKVVNIMETYESGLNGVISDNNQFEITGNAVLYKPLFVRLISGSLTAGKVQYAIQLFNTNGSETMISPLSDMIVIVNDTVDNGSLNIEGDELNETSSKGVQIRCYIPTNSFERLRLYRLEYPDNNVVPTISIVDEFNIDISDSDNELLLSDAGNSYVSDITLDEFNAYTGYSFIAQTLCKMGNRLYAANITEDNWYPSEEDYDARAYRCNSNYEVSLGATNTNDSIFIDDIRTYDLSTIPYDHDCINSYNSCVITETDDEDKYMYGYVLNGDSSYLYLGGSGLNIDYRFVTTDIYLTDSDILNQDDVLYRVTYTGAFDKSVTPEDVDTVYFRQYASVSYSSIEYSESVDNSTLHIRNYSDSLYASKYVGYRRDEVYRFGIIFYNDRQVASQVYWIGDIRMPSAAQIPIFVSENGRLVGKALGINFIVKNLPENTVSYEIVRCDRTSSDRTILMQCVGSAIYQYNIQEDGDNGGIRGQGTTIDTSTEYRPLPFLGFPDRDFHIDNRWESGAPRSWSTSLNQYNIVPYDIQATNYMRLISPEICYEGESTEDYFTSDVYLEQIGIGHGSNHHDVNTGDNMSTTAWPMSGATSTVLYDGDYGLTYSYVLAEISESDSDNPVFHMVHHLDAQYPAFIAPYYDCRYYDDSSSIETTSITDAVYPQIFPYNAFQSVDITSYKENVGEIVYTNYAMTRFGNYGGSTDSGAWLGPAGPCIVVKTSESRPWAILAGHSGLLVFGENTIAIPIYNLKRDNTSQYGGNTYYARSTSSYISIGAACENPDDVSQDHFIVYGGDTYIDILDYPSMMTFQANLYSDYQDRTALVANYIPFESSINISLDCGDSEWRGVGVAVVGIYDWYGTVVNSHVQMDPVQIGNYYVQDEAYYAYNDAYSAQSDSITHSSADVYSESNETYSNRIIVSEAKTNGEVTDSWTTFLTANYLDVDNLYGPITNLITFKDKLFYFQDNAVGIASVNERSLITDNNVSTLTLGTGDILSRYDYVTNMYGTSIANSKGIITTENTLYWYDNNRHELMAYTGSITNLSKEKNVLTYFDSTLPTEAVSTLFDKKYNEVWFTFDDKTLTFNERLGQFTSFYTLTPDWVLPYSSGNAIIDVIYVYYPDTGNVSYFYNQFKRINEGNNEDGSDITLIINKDMLYTKVYDNIFIAGNLTDDDSVTSIEFNTKTQTATLVPVFDVREDTYRTFIPRADAVGTEDENLSFPARLRGKYLIVKYNFNNTSEVLFQIPEITTSYRYSRV